jgi:hypothetical protein
MRRVLLFLFVFAFCSGPLLSADEQLIDPDQAPTHIGQSVTVSGLVVAVFMSKAGNVFINFGDKYPHQTFTGWVPAGTPLASDPSLEQLISAAPVRRISGTYLFLAGQGKWYRLSGWGGAPAGYSDSIEGRLPQVSRPKPVQT